MTNTTHRRLSTVALWLSVGLNVILTGLDLRAGHVVAAGFRLPFAALLIVGIWVLEYSSRLFEARIGKARAERDLAHLAFEQMQRHMTMGQVQTEIHTHARKRAN
jgi:hypothetical protein